MFPAKKKYDMNDFHRSYRESANKDWYGNPKCLNVKNPKKKLKGESSVKYNQNFNPMYRDASNADWMKSSSQLQRSLRGDNPKQIKKKKSCVKWNQINFSQLYRQISNQDWLNPTTMELKLLKITKLPERIETKPQKRNKYNTTEFHALYRESSNRDWYGRLKKNKTSKPSRGTFN